MCLDCHRLQYFGVRTNAVDVRCSALGLHCRRVDEGESLLPVLFQVFRVEVLLSVSLLLQSHPHYLPTTDQVRGFDCSYPASQLASLADQQVRSMGHLKSDSSELPSKESEADGSLFPYELRDDIDDIIIAPPTGIDNQADLFARPDSHHPKKIFVQVLDILKGARPGSDLIHMQIPAQLNLPKSQLQCYAEQVYCCGQNLLEQCADAATPLERCVAVVAFQCSLIRPAPFCKVPYNPVLGETHNVSAGDLNVMAEQVSHHPPITAVYATNTIKGIEFFQSSQPIVKFWGSSVEVNLIGRRDLILTKHGEMYKMSPPNLLFRFLPHVCSEWTGDTFVRCSETDLEATLSFKPSSLWHMYGARNEIHGTIKRTSTNRVLYTFHGNWDKIVTLENSETGEKSVLFDAGVALTNFRTPVIKDKKALSPKDSVVVWRKLTEGLSEQHWEAARAAKLSVEQHQRALRHQRKQAGETWEPQYFIQTAEHGWDWALKGEPVPKGPIVW